MHVLHQAVAHLVRNLLGSVWGVQEGGEGVCAVGEEEKCLPALLTKDTHA